MENRWVFVTSSGIAFVVTGSISGLFKPHLDDIPIVAYCSDYKIRKFLRVTSWKPPERSGLLSLLSRTAWRAVPVLSKPVGSYSVEDLKRLLENHIRPLIKMLDIDPEWETRAISEASTFDDLYRLMRDPGYYLADKYDIEFDD